MRCGCIIARTGVNIALSPAFNTTILEKGSKHTGIGEDLRKTPFVKGDPIGSAVQTDEGRVVARQHFCEGYRIDTGKNAYTEIYWVSPIEYKYYILRGIRWYDVTDPQNVKDVYENDVFIEGHKYKVVVYLVTNDGYECAYDLYTEPETWPTASVNGNEAEVTQFGSDLKWSQEISYTFPEAETAPDSMKGDFDFDGKITVADALAALRIAARMAEETAESILIGDIDGDGAVTVADSLAILRVAAKMSDTL